MKAWKSHNSEKLLEFADNEWYIKHTNEQVIIRKVEGHYMMDRADIKYIVDIEFLSKEPDKKALSIVGAVGRPDVYASIGHTLYSGHPSPNYEGAMIWTARVDLRQLCNVPFGTPAGEVLFGKKK